MASKKTRKINKAPSGVSFMYVERESAGPLAHTWHDDEQCGGTVSVIGKQQSPPSNRPDAVIYGCDTCDWTSPSGEFQHEPSVRQPHHVCTEVVKGNGPVDPIKLRNRVRKEVRRRMAILTVERAKFPPSLIEKGKGKRKRWINNPDFTDAMRAHMHRFYVSGEEIRDALKNGDPLPKYPLPPKKKTR